MLCYVAQAGTGNDRARITEQSCESGGRGGVFFCRLVCGGDADQRLRTVDAEARAA